MGFDLGHYSDRAKNDQVEFDWKTHTETYSSHFILEKSTDGTNPVQISQVRAAGNSQSKINYRCSCNESDLTFHHYRIVQIDLDGIKDYFNWIHAKPSCLNKSNPLYPNHSNGLFSIYNKNLVEDSYCKFMTYRVVMFFT